MPFVPSKYRSELYYQFSEIGRTEYRSIIQFYEDNLPDIDNLEFQEFFELHLVYLNALFEIGAYAELLRKIDPAIYTVIDQNIIEFEGKDVYVDLLTRKASALYQLRRYDEAIHICQELIKMKKSSSLPPLLLKKCLLKKAPKYVGRLRGLSLLSLLIATICFGINLLILPVESSWWFTLEVVRGLALLIGVLCLAASWLAPQLISTIEVEKILQNH